MRAKPKAQLQILTASDREPEILRIVRNTAHVRVFFQLDAMAAIENGVNLCNFRVLDSQPRLKSKQRLGALDSSVALNAPATRKLIAQSRQASVVVRGSTDVTSNIPNDAIKNITRGEGVRKRKLIRFVSQGEEDSIESFASEPTVNEQITKSTSSILPFRLDLIHLSAKDPASEVNRADFQRPAQLSIRGLRTVDDLSKFSVKQKLFRKSITSETGVGKRIKVEDEIEKTIEIPCNFKIDKSNLKKYTFEVDAVTKRFRSSLERVVQTISFEIDLRESLEEFLIPTIPPSLEVTSVGSSRFIRVKQADKNGTSVKVFRRIIETTSTDQAQFSLIADVPALQNETIQIVDRPESAGKCIYRAVTYNELAMTSGEFSGFVTRAANQIRRDSHPDTTALLAAEDNDGIYVRVYSIPNDVVAVRILRRSLTLHEKNFVTPNTVEGSVIKQLDRASSFVEFRDRPKRSNSVYEYAVDLIDSHGNVKRSSKTSITRFVGDRSSSGSYRLVSSDQMTSLEPDPTFTFQVTAPNDEASLDSLYEILVEAGLDSQYVDEIKQNRELFNKIVGIEMLRFDTVTGLNESFGLVKTGVFEDSNKSRSSKNVSPLVQGRTYIYQFRLLLRAASTLFSSSVVSNIDLETGRTYATKMKKFNSPKIFRNGTLASTSSQQNTLSKTGIKLAPESSSEGEMFQGVTSLVGELQVTIPSRDTSLSNLKVESTPRGNIIRWKVTQGLSPIDHIIVFAEYNGTLAPIRAIHAVEQSNMMYLDTKIAAALDSISYYVQPIFTNFSEGPMIGPAEL